MPADDLKDTEPSRRAADAIICAGCGGASGPDGRGWLAYRVDDSLHDEPPELGFYCPICAGQRLGRRTAR